jgi:DNA-directed RNA polymerase alpha subunit
LTIEFLDPSKLINLGSSNLNAVTKELLIHSIPKPVKQVNYTIQKLSNFPDQEYISLEIWTDGSITPLQALNYVLEELTKLFFQFTKLASNTEQVLND